VPIGQGLGINLNAYHEGVYAQYSRDTKYLSLYQLPSLNHGTEMKHWCHKGPTAVAGLAIDSTLDLLVWLEARDRRPFHLQDDIPYNYQYTIHLHSMTTNVEHPEAYSGSISYNFSAAGTIAVPTVHILGNLLAVLFISIRPRDPCHAVVWDWTTGVELAVSWRICSPSVPEKY
jgi:hypothetical protein